MAAIQTQFPVGYRSNSGRTVVLPQRQTQRATTVAMPDLSAVGIAVACAALIAIIYITGFARMTAVSYQRARILQQISDLQVKGQIVQTKLTEQTVKETVASWAVANGMEQANGRALVLNGDLEAR